MVVLSATITRFIASEEGAIAVDWVVLTAALVGSAMAAMLGVSGGGENLSGDTNALSIDQEITAALATPPSTPTPTLASDCDIVRISARVGPIVDPTADRFERTSRTL